MERQLEGIPGEATPAPSLDSTSMLLTQTGGRDQTSQLSTSRGSQKMQCNEEGPLGPVQKVGGCTEDLHLQTKKQRGEEVQLREVQRGV